MRLTCHDSLHFSLQQTCTSMTLNQQLSLLPLDKLEFSSFLYRAVILKLLMEKDRKDLTPVIT